MHNYSVSRRNIMETFINLLDQIHLRFSCSRIFKKRMYVWHRLDRKAMHNGLSPDNTKSSHFWCFQTKHSLFLCKTCILFVPEILAYEMHLFCERIQGLETYENANVRYIFCMHSNNFRNWCTYIKMSADAYLEYCWITLFLSQ